MDAKVWPNMKVVFVRAFENPKKRLDGTRQILRTLVAMAVKKAA